MSRNENIENLTQFREVLRLMYCFYSLTSSIQKWHIFESQKTKLPLSQKPTIHFSKYRRTKLKPTYYYFLHSCTNCEGL